MNFQYLHYKEWEGKAMLKHTELIDKYNSLKQKEGMMAESKEGKENKKDILLKHKANNTLSKIGFIELEMIDKEDIISSSYNRNILMITQRRDKKLREAEEEFERATGYYSSERDASMAKTKREFESKKRSLELRGEAVEAERSLAIRSGAEITLEKQKYDLLKQIKTSIDTISMSRGQCPKDTIFDTELPKLPEALPVVAPFAQPVSAFTPSTIVTYIHDMPSWVANIGEDASVAIMRAEARAEDARARREAALEEMMLKEQALQYRRQLEDEARVRAKANAKLRGETLSDSE
jgi:hypothetical protein